MKRVIFLFFFLNYFNLLSQVQTVGLFTNDSQSFKGYTLFSPNSNTYLIDNCGKLINSWNSSYNAGSSVYLLENGSLLRTCRIQNPIFSAGGSGGRIEKTDWYGNLEWSYNFSDSLYHQHHDIAPLKNGNILVLCWEYKSLNEAVDAGRDPNTINDNELWSTYILEVEPIGNDSINIIWEWRLWDHLIQDFDSTKQNFGVISQNPQRLDINYYFGNGKNDWLHCNSIDYNEDLDQIVLGSRALSELYIIDHSTTTYEATSSLGGNSNKGGNFLYRWGNPQAYDAANVDQKLFGQHDVHWIDDNYLDGGKLLIFNNGKQRGYSSVDIVNPAIDSNGSYIIDSLNMFQPLNADWIYTSSPQQNFYSSYISGSQRLANGNTLICDGAHGNFFEIDAQDNIVWRYVNPVLNTYILSQGDSIPVTQNGFGNSVFRCTRYPIDYSAFDNKDMTPSDPIELNPIPDSCTMITSTFAEISNDKELIKVVDLMGRNTKIEHNTILFYIYSDGTVEKIFKIF